MTLLKKREAQHKIITNGKNSGKIKYNYRTGKNEFFSCITNTLDEAIEKRDAWFVRIGATEELAWVRR
jgi:hypothetical protein